MRRIVCSVVLAAAILCLALTACGSRQKTDLSKATTIADLKGAVIAGQAGTFHLDVIDQIDGVEKKSYPDFTDLLNALKSGAIDGYVAEEPTALEVCGKDDTLTYLPFVNNDTGFTATDARDAALPSRSSTGSEHGRNRQRYSCYHPHRDPSGADGADGEPQCGPRHAVERRNCPSVFQTPTPRTVCSASRWNAPTRPSTGRRRPTPTALCPSPGKDNLYASGYDVQVAKYIAAELGMSLEVYSYEWDSPDRRRSVRRCRRDHRRHEPRRPSARSRSTSPTATTTVTSWSSSRSKRFQARIRKYERNG